MSPRLIWIGMTVLLPGMVLLFAWETGRSLAATAVSAQIAAPFDVIINEWSQGEGGNKEWVELLVVNGPIDLRGWDLGDLTPGDLHFAADPFWANVASGTLIVVYNGNDRDNNVLPADDDDLSDCTAVLPHNGGYFSGSWPLFSNTDFNDNPILRDSGDNVIHNFTEAPGSVRHPGANQAVRFNADNLTALPAPANWSFVVAANATPAAGNTAVNSAWIASLCQGSGGGGSVADLQVGKSGPTLLLPEQPLVYAITLQNSGNHTATQVVLTDTLPLGVTYAQDDSGFPLSQPLPNTLVWQVGTVPTGTLISFYLTATVQITPGISITNTVHASTSYTETNLANNVATAVTFLDDGLRPIVLLDAVYYDGYALNDIDEAVALRNVGQAPANLSGWRLSDGSSQATIPPGVTLPPGGVIWLTGDAPAFAASFGFAPDVVLSSWPGFANAGDEVLLLNEAGHIQDALVYKAGNTAQNGWSGTAVFPYLVTSVFGETGQILYRRLEQQTGQPVPDTNTAADWASWRDDVINGRKVRYPGWDLEQFFFTRQLTETAVITLAIAPDNAYESIIAALDDARHTIQIQSHTFENLGIAAALVRASQRGISVTVLLEGAPPGGLTDQEKYVCAQLDAAGGACWFMISDEEARIGDRYRFLHAKFVLIDGRLVLISSENLSPSSMPDDDKQDGTWGRRGLLLHTNAPGVVAHVQAIFDADFDPMNHADLFRWQADSPTYGLPAAGFVPITQTGGITYAVRYPETAVFQGSFFFELIQSPENSLRTQDSLLGLLNRAGAGDVILVQQLTERPYWGASSSNPLADPNPRLEAYLNAARRGATVRMLLDSYFDTPSLPTSNAATCRYVQAIAHQEQLDLRCARANPTGLGIHNKMVLVQLNGRGYVHLGSLNGTEQAHKGNRELAIQFASDEAYALLVTMFYQDWPWQAYLPIALKEYVTPADYVLISEVFYDPPGNDEYEFIELVNPTPYAVDLSGYSISDAVNPTDFEDLRRFPAGTILAPGQTLVIATTAVAFRQAFGFNPHFEILETDAAVPNLLKDLNWGDPVTFIQLGNQGDEVILRDTNDMVIDVVTYGTGSYPGVTPAPLLPASNYSLERFPFWRDTNNCANDFRAWPFPNPGRLPQ